MDKSKLLKIVSYILIVSLPLLLFVAEHEYTHMYFAHEHGCENITVHGPEWNGNIWNSSAASVSYSDCERTKMLNLKQEMTEAVGYQKAIQIFLLSFILLIVLSNEWGRMRMERKIDKLIKEKSD